MASVCPQLRKCFTARATRAARSPSVEPVSGEERAERIRAFVALDLSARLVSRLSAWQASALAGRRELRPVRPESLHLTLAFLGHLEPDLVDRAAEIVDGAGDVARPVPIRLGTDLIDLPRRRPRAIAVDVGSPEAVGLQARLSTRLFDAGVYLPGSRPFRPHLTVARVRGSPRAGGRGRRLSEGLPPLPGEAGHTFGAVRIALYRSRLGPGGASYTALTAFELPPLEGAADEVI